MKEITHTHLNLSTILALRSPLSFAKNCDSIALTSKNWPSLRSESPRYTPGQHVVHKKPSLRMGDIYPKLVFDHQNLFFKSPL